MVRRIVYLLVFLGVAFLIRLHTLGGNSQKMTYKKSSGDVLRPCTSELNCYQGTLSSESNHLNKIQEYLKTNDSYKVLDKSENHIYFTHTSAIFNFVDDMEFLYDKKLKKLHYRSSSRVGKSDLGANKKRIDSILASLTL